MPDSTHKHQLKLEDLALYEGAAVLLRRALTQLAQGEWLEVQGDSAELAEHLSAWCRKEGHRLETAQGATRTYRIEASAATPVTSTSRSEVSETADPHWEIGR